MIVLGKLHMLPWLIGKIVIHILLQWQAICQIYSRHYKHSIDIYGMCSMLDWFWTLKGHFYMCLSAAFNTIDRDILIDRLQNYTGIQGQALRWFRSYLSDWYHFVYLNGESSQLSPVKYGVPQGSVLGPLLFSIYMLPLGNIISKYGIRFHCYGNDTQLYISTKPDETSKLSKLTECVKNVKDWMTNNFLLLDSDKTEILLIGPKNSTQNLLDYNLQLD